jgi:hypothetical protein
MSGVWSAPTYLHAVYLLILCQIWHDPLRVQRIAVSGETLREIGIAFPVRLYVPICQPRVACISCPIIPSEPRRGKAYL